ncbi:barstar family protein [Streptomyces fulvoviolaceus]|uniref:barstar family protein n=1 Tax=Streptomyces fulvoviolaceus TaxID=285535 RepID=UPI0021BFC4E5|nr:barstar family protein [Streptomyces fulvoviolaceus]MCT9084792.1 barstar family protein [Streptomyces fulvoviolaceus]
MPKTTPTELVVDLRGRPFDTLEQFWDALTEPLGLPEWFGRNTEALRDTLQVGGISDVIDSHDVVIVHVDKQGIFTRRDRETRHLRSAFAGKQSRLVIHVPS